jgi:hypothetical protein
MSHTYSMQDLLALMQQLRDPENGCPWDKKQDLAESDGLYHRRSL